MIAFLNFTKRLLPGLILIVFHELRIANVEIMRDSKPGGVKSFSEATERRRKETTDIAARSRDDTVTKKRLRRDASAASLGLSRPASTASLGGAFAEDMEAVYTPLPAPEDIEAQVQAAVDAMTAATPIGGPSHLEATRSLRQLLSNYENPPYAAVLAADGVPALVAALQPPRMDDTALETILEAAWALTNLAVGNPDAVRAVLSTAPLLIAHLGGGSGLAVAEQCAWALGNLAGDDVEHRETLTANGAIPPLAGLLIAGSKAAAVPEASDDVPEVSAATTAAWALENLLRGVGGVRRAEIAGFMETEGAPEAVVHAAVAAPPRLAVEAAWVLAYLTGGQDAYLNRFVTLGMLPPLCARLEATVEVFLKNGEEAGTLDVLTPLLRVLGNFAAAGGGAAVEELLSEDTLKAVVVCAESEHHHGLQREAAWVLASLAGAPGRAGVEAIKKAGALPALMSLLKIQPFHVKKEAAYALANVAAGGGGGTGDAEATNYLFGADADAVRAMLSLLRSPDMQAAQLGLQFAEMLMRLLPSGAREVEAADGIDAIEALQFGEAPPELQAAAAALVDKYFGVNKADE